MGVSSRRVLLLGACLALLGKRTALAQEAGRRYRLAFVGQATKEKLAALFDELLLNGFVDGDNLSVDPYGFGVPVERLDEIAANIINGQPDVIYVGGAAAGQAVKRATAKIPLVVARMICFGKGLSPRSPIPAQI